MSKILGTRKISHDGREHWPNESEGCEYCSTEALTQTVLRQDAAIADLRSQLEEAQRERDATKADWEEAERQLGQARREAVRWQAAFASPSVAEAVQALTAEVEAERTKREAAERALAVWREKAWKHAEEVTEAERKARISESLVEMSLHFEDSGKDIGALYRRVEEAERRLDEALAALERALMAGILEDFGSPSPSEQARAVLASQTEEGNG